MIGIDDFPFTRGKDTTTTIIGTLMRLDFKIEGFSSETISLDGMDSTRAIISIRKKVVAKSVAAMLLNGVTFGGMNIANISEIYRETDTPVICVSRKHPSLDSMKSVIEKYHNDKQAKNELLERLEPIRITLRNGRSVYANLSGITVEKAREILSMQCKLNTVPESIRISHMIGSAMKIGVSKGRA